MANASLSVASFENRNNVSLAQLNIDLALIKYDAPEEYRQVGRTISKSRKKSAEDGPLHRTARRLGELFKDLLPKTPTLLCSYGSRVSEITSKTSVNPQGVHLQDGLFSAHIGIDSASIWAAATSGTSSIAVHLLACMLARNFSVEQATSIWVELVEKRKEILTALIENDLFPQEHLEAKAALQQEISRQDLRQWDASARAWLQSADQAKLFEHKQMQVIINNAAIPVNTEPTTYRSVTVAWTAALEAMDNLLRGVPQKVQDGAALLAISSWHLYPDMVVYRGRDGKGIDVTMKDRLFKATSLLTLGLEAVRPGSVSWSLPLARMQYYGDPVQVTAVTGQDNARITPEEFSYAILGAVLCTWGPPNVITLVNHAFVWLQRIIAFARLDLLHPSEKCRFDFLEYLYSAAKGINSLSDGVSSATAVQLFKLGVRRSKRFLYFNGSHIPPLFGISEITNLLSLLRTFDVKKRAIYHYMSLYEKQMDYPRFLFLSKSSDTGRLILSGKSTRWIAVRVSEVRQYLSLRLISPELESEIARQRPCFPALIPDFYWEILLSGLGEDQKDIDFSQTPVDPIFMKVEMKIASVVDGLDFRQAMESFDFHNYIVYKYLDDKLEGDRVLCAESPPPGLSDSKTRLDEPSMLDVLTPETVDTWALRRHLSKFWEHHEAVQAVSACASVDSLFRSFTDSTITTRILDTPFSYQEFLPNHRLEQCSDLSNLPRIFGLICAFDSGLYADPIQLSNVFALASGNSIYVASSLLRDPYESPSPIVHRVIGNVGRPGLSFLVRPTTVKVSKPKDQDWRVINHLDFDGKPENNFQNTSVHLSFTDYEIGLLPSMHMSINPVDQAVKIVETAVSAYDGSRWVADLDIIEALRGVNFSGGCIADGHGFLQECEGEEAGSNHHRNRQTRQPQHPQHPQHPLKPCSSSHESLQEIMASYGIPTITAIDNWDEILDPPTSPVIAVRASGNWLARMTLLTVCVEKGYFVLVAAKSQPCWPHLFDRIKQIQQSQLHSTYRAMEALHPGTRPHSAKRKHERDEEFDRESSNTSAKKLKAPVVGEETHNRKGVMLLVDQTFENDDNDTGEFGRRFWKKFAIIL